MVGRGCCYCCGSGGDVIVVVVCGSWVHKLKGGVTTLPVVVVGVGGGVVWACRGHGGVY